MKDNIIIGLAVIAVFLSLIAVVMVVNGQKSFGRVDNSTGFDDVYVSKTLEVAGASTLTGAVSMPGGFTSASVTSTLGVTINGSPLYIKTSSTYCTKVVPSTTAAALTITTSTSCQ